METYRQNRLQIDHFKLSLLKVRDPSFFDRILDRKNPPVGKKVLKSSSIIWTMTPCGCPHNKEKPCGTFSHLALRTQKKVGIAPKRTKLRRLGRNSLAKSPLRDKGWDMIITFVKDSPYEQIKQELEQLLAKWEKWLCPPN